MRTETSAEGLGLDGNVARCERRGSRATTAEVSAPEASRRLRLAASRLPRTARRVSKEQKEQTQRQFRISCLLPAVPRVRTEE